MPPICCCLWLIYTSEAWRGGGGRNYCLSRDKKSLLWSNYFIQLGRDIAQYTTASPGFLQKSRLKDLTETLWKNATDCGWWLWCDQEEMWSWLAFSLITEVPDEGNLYSFNLNPREWRQWDWSKFQFFLFSKIFFQNYLWKSFWVPFVPHLEQV